MKIIRYGSVINDLIVDYLKNKDLKLYLLDNSRNKLNIGSGNLEIEHESIVNKEKISFNNASDNDIEINYCQIECNNDMFFIIELDDKIILEPNKKIELNKNSIRINIGF